MKANWKKVSCRVVVNDRARLKIISSEALSESGNEFN
jgi:hypothetical protein